ncbi:helix-turn-helix domain-containing protein [Nostocaceae cyanobacterium CENA369]|uniref:Helix-turn-helix domain-containing protein n=1 Tax=Dendronalium phyllosphericum CENA369 TaxID=1725256 RepID=A0A8J7I9C6_9NOST|nr:helix-turn-helix domain-containing protein [Dendronalium phyllosphericum]MBH8576588.1 helix-turn-helix domain-containing protein [Dendronalium phyllosphericum CENA369]
MTLILPYADYLKLLYQAEIIQNNDSSDNFDIIRKYQFGQGYWRQIQLRDSISLEISYYQQPKSFILKLQGRKHPLEFRFLILLESEFKNLEFKTGEYFLSGSGMASECAVLEPSARIVEVAIHLHPNVFHSFSKNTSGKLPKELQHLIRRWDQPTYERYGTQTPAMQIAVQQILQCPYQGFTKQIYLESKVWELVAMLVEQEVQINQGCFQINKLKPLDIDRIYNVREIVLKHLDNPPSLIELARQVGLNDCTMKQGFKQVFGTTVFGYLHHCRMQLAYKLLIERNMNVTEVARTVGYASLPSFSNAFRKKFGVSPKSCQR